MSARLTNYLSNATMFSPSTRTFPSSCFGPIIIKTGSAHTIISIPFYIPLAARPQNALNQSAGSSHSGAISSCRLSLPRKWPFIKFTPSVKHLRHPVGLVRAQAGRLRPHFNAAERCQLITINHFRKDANVPSQPSLMNALQPRLAGPSLAIPFGRPLLRRKLVNPAGAMNENPPASCRGWMCSLY